MADTIAVMHEGRVEQLGSPVELYESPVSRYVANFLGQSNCLEGAVRDVRARGDGRRRRRRVLPCPGGTGGPAAPLSSRRPSGEDRGRRRRGAPRSRTAQRHPRHRHRRVLHRRLTQYLVRTPCGGRDQRLRPERRRRAPRRRSASRHLAWRPEHTFPLEAPEGRRGGGPRSGADADGGGVSVSGGGGTRAGGSPRPGAGRRTDPAGRLHPVLAAAAGPGLLIFFFVLPMLDAGVISLTRGAGGGLHAHLELGNYSEAWHLLRRSSSGRSSTPARPRC